MIRRPPRSTQSRSSAASDVYKRQDEHRACTLVGEQPVDAARGTSLVVRMGVYREKCQLFHLQSSKEISFVAGCHITAPGTLVILDTKEQRKEFFVHRDKVGVVHL